MRIRALAALLSCLAVLAGGFSTVAAASLPLLTAASEHGMENAPCSNCDECGMAPCPMPDPACLQASSTSASTLAVAAFELPTIASSEIRWTSHSTFLTGLTRPPDPFPPRA